MDQALTILDVMERTILVVDDHQLNLSLARTLLTDEGYTVLTAADGETALETFASTPPDLALLDVSLPGIDGLEVLRRIRADAATAAIPVIVLTAGALPEEEERAWTAGCDAFHTKPPDVDRLLADVARLLMGRPD
jgi:CheY-like chemotaxis protein